MVDPACDSGQPCPDPSNGPQLLNEVSLVLDKTMERVGDGATEYEAQFRTMGQAGKLVSADALTLLALRASCNALSSVGQW